MCRSVALELCGSRIICALRSGLGVERANAPSSANSGQASSHRTVRSPGCVCNNTMDCVLVYGQPMDTGTPPVEKVVSGDCGAGIDNNFDGRT